MEDNNPEEKDIDISEFVNEDHIGKIPPTTKAQSQIIISQLDKHICKILVSKEKFGTGFFCKIRYPDEFRLLPTLITNNHVLNEKELEINHTIKITLEDDTIEKNILIDKSRLTYTNPDLDVTIIQIKPEDEIDSFLDIDENVFNKDYAKIYKKDTPIYLLQYPEGVFASHAVGRIDKILKARIFHSCSTEPGSSGSPILLLSNFKVIAVHKGSKKEKTENINLGTWIKYPIEEFNKKYPNIVKDNINPFKPIIFQEEDINKKIPENPENINNKQEINNVNIIDYNKNNNNTNNEDKQDFEFVDDNDNYDNDNQICQSNNNNNNNYRENNQSNSNSNSRNYNSNQHYYSNNSNNNNSWNNNNQKGEKNYNNPKKSSPINNSNNTKSIIEVYICPNCFEKKECCLCNKKTSKIIQTSFFLAHSTCLEENKCFQCGENGSTNFLNICENCKNNTNQLKLKKSKCFKCEKDL